MRYTILVLTIVLTAGATQARADMIAYNMTGTITQVMAARDSSLGVGDQISWTIQYDRSTPHASEYETLYDMKHAIITNIVDQTTGDHFPTPYSRYVNSTVQLTQGVGSGPAGFQAADDGPIDQSYSYAADVLLWAKGRLPTLNLANLWLYDVPWVLGSPPPNLGYSSSFLYNNFNVGGAYFSATLASVSGPLSGAPEPRSLTLFLLGAVALTARGICRRLRFRLVSFLAVAGDC
jgi:hypothetical protein